MKYCVEYYCISHIGHCRKENQDNFICDKEIMPHKNSGTEKMLTGCVDNSENAVFAVFDGMGGEECGEMASYIAAKEMRDVELPNDNGKELLNFCERANTKICEYTAENNLSSMGTTAAVLRFTSDKIWLCNIGDSKIFRISASGLKQISVDHVGFARYGSKPPLSQNLGIPKDELQIEPNLACGNYKDSDIYIVCSDGLTDMVKEGEIQQILSEPDRQSACQKLLQTALDNGGKDNITFIVLYVQKNKNKLLSIFSRKRGT